MVPCAPSELESAFMKVDVCMILSLSFSCQILKMPRPCRSFSWTRFSWARSCWLRVRRPSGFLNTHRLPWNAKCPNVFPRRLREGCGSPDQRHRCVRPTTAAPAGAAADVTAARLPDAAHQTTIHQSGERDTSTLKVCRPAHFFKTPHELRVAFGTRKNAREKPRTIQS